MSDFAITINPAKAVRVAQQTTLFDGKLVNKTTLDTDLWCSAVGGSGSLDYSNGNRVLMSVSGNGDYAILQSNRFMPYFSGKVQDVEGTFISFQLQSGIIKRFGYFSRNAVAPFNSNLDGFWIESNGDENRLKVISKNDGVETTVFQVAIGQPDAIPECDWAKFNVVLFSFLWLGGAALEVAQAFPQGFKVIGSSSISGMKNDVICKSPNQPICYEIRSTGGSGSFTAVCNQVATAGSINESGRGRIARNIISIPASVADTVYFLLAVRRNTANRNLALLINSIEGVLRTKDDAGTLIIAKTPTLTGDALVWAAHETGEFDVALATNQTATALGRIIDARNMTSSGMADTNLDNNVMSWLSSDIQNSADIFALLYIPETNNQYIKGLLHLKIF